MIVMLSGLAFTSPPNHVIQSNLAHISLVAKRISAFREKCGSRSPFMIEQNPPGEFEIPLPAHLERSETSIFRRRQIVVELPVDATEEVVYALHHVLHILQFNGAGWQSWNQTLLVDRIP